MSFSVRNTNGRGVLYLAFNQSRNCFVCVTDNGYRVYNSDPLKEVNRHDFTDGTIAQAEMLFCCNVIALMGGGIRPICPPNKIIIWDDIKKKIAVLLDCEEPVKAVRLRRDRIVVVLERSIKVYTLLNPPKLLHTLDTNHNLNALCALGQSNQLSYLAYPSHRTGYVKIVHFNQLKNAPVEFQAHKNAVSYMAMSEQGNKLVTASERGTLIRVFDTSSGETVTELRRGYYQAKINCINFNPSETAIVVSSDHDTVHIFNLETSAPAGMIRRLITSQWSFCKITIPQGSPCICAFGEERNKVVAACANGQYYKFSYDRKGRNNTEWCTLFLEMCEEEI